MLSVVTLSRARRRAPAHPEQMAVQARTQLRSLSNDRCEKVVRAVVKLERRCMNPILIRMCAACAGFLIMAHPAAAQSSGGAANRSPVTSAAPAGPPGAATAVEAFQRPAFIAGRGPGVLRAADFIGKAVYGLSGQTIGEVEDVLFEEDGRMSGLVIEIGGFLGIGDREVALPLHAFRIDPATTATSGTIGGPPASTIAGAQTRSENRISAVVVPERIFLLLPEDQLKTAPRFEDGGLAR